MRNSTLKQAHKRSIHSRLRTLERKYVELLGAGKKEDAAQSLRVLSSAFDKAAKKGVVHRATANRKKSRLALSLARVK